MADALSIAKNIALGALSAEPHVQKVQRQASSWASILGKPQQAFKIPPVVSLPPTFPGAGSLMGEDTVNFLTYQKFQRDYMWEVLFPDIGQFRGDIVGKLCQSADFGEYSMEGPFVMRKGAITAKFPSKFNIKNATFKFLLTADKYIVGYIGAWRQKIVSDKGLFEGNKNQYARRILVNFLNQDGAINTTATLLRTFPTNFPSYSLNYDGNSALMVTVGFSVDDVE